mmetsp:Transcript_16731/g.16639  ORF Transcript_16731/g.16639 Transcript_16731/m.16639 type:complete len:174 (+) Transcript_16731:14-535(+)
MSFIDRLNLTQSVWFCCIYPNCSNHYNTKFNLKQHIENVHLKLKKYQCKYCQKLLISKQNLKEHLNIHTESTPFKCKICEKSFRQASQLSLHKRTHSENDIIAINQEQTKKRNKQAKDFYTPDVSKLESNFVMTPVLLNLPLIRDRKEFGQRLPAFTSISRKSNPYIIKNKLH